MQNYHAVPPPPETFTPSPATPAKTHLDMSGRIHRKIAMKELHCLDSLRKGCHFHDCVIKVGGARFPVDRNVMSCCSPFFLALFEDAKNKTLEATNIKKAQSWKNTNQSSQSVVNAPCSQSQMTSQMTEKSAHSATPRRTQRCLVNSVHHDHSYASVSDAGTPGCHTVSRRRPLEVGISDVTADVMHEVIEHAYGSDVTITDRNFDKLLVAADRFQIPSLLGQCMQYLDSHISEENCITIVKFVSHFFQCESTRQKATRFFLDNFSTVRRISPDFVSLSVSELTSVLTADRLNVRREEEVLHAIMTWLTASPGDRIAHIPQLVSCVRIGLMLPESINGFVDPWLRSHKDITIQVMESVMTQQRAQMALVDPSMFSPRLPRDVLLVCGGSNCGLPISLLEAFDCRTSTWHVVAQDHFAPRSYHAMVELHNDLYIMGGFNGHEYLSSCVKFSPHSLTWTSINPMNAKRCYVGAATLRGEIYCVGGYEGTDRMNTAEKFNTSRNQWSYICPMLQQRSDAGVAVLHDKLYVCGGFNGRSCIHAVEHYDPNTDQWTSCAAMSLCRSGLGLVAYRDCLYAVGGFDGVDGSVRLDAVEAYVPDTNEWWALHNMPSPRSNLCVDVLEDTLYAIGGYDGSRTTGAVEAYDFTTNTWYQCPRLSHSRSALSVAVVRGLDTTAYLLGRHTTCPNMAGLHGN